MRISRNLTIGASYAAGDILRNLDDGHEGFVVPIRDANAIADRLEQVITDRRLRDAMSRAARARAEELTWNHFGDLLVGATRDAMRVRAAQENLS